MNQQERRQLSICEECLAGRMNRTLAAKKLKTTYDGVVFRYWSLKKKELKAEQDKQSWE